MLLDASIMDTDLACHICDAQQLNLLSSYNTLPRVTSDCVPWRSGGRLGICEVCSCVQNPVDKDWYAETSEIYSTYQIYRQSAGSEQGVISEGKHLVPRSEKIFQQAKRYLSLKKRGRLLDVGCANGGLLRFFGTLAPHWKMVGFEIDDKRREEVESIDGVEAFVSGSLDNLKNHFDLITLIHVLEHLPNPRKWLEEFHRLLNPGGFILIQLPDPRQNPFNLLVADHCSHFILADIKRLVEQAGYQITVCSDNWVSREFSILATPLGSSKTEGKYINSNLSLYKKKDSSRKQIGKASSYPAASLQWLQNIAHLAESLPHDKPRGIWGTAIAATWVYSVMGKIDFFVDEDANRVGQQHLGKPIYSPNSVPEGSHIFIALTPEIATSIANRWSHLDVCMHVPPDLIYDE